MWRVVQVVGAHASGLWGFALSVLSHIAHHVLHHIFAFTSPDVPPAAKATLRVREPKSDKPRLAETKAKPAVPILFNIETPPSLSTFRHVTFAPSPMQSTPTSPAPMRPSFVKSASFPILQPSARFPGIVQRAEEHGSSTQSSETTPPLSPFIVVASPTEEVHLPPPTPLEKPSTAPRKPSKEKKSKPPPAPPLRTQPYAAPYFFPSPASPEATDYVRLLREERRVAALGSPVAVRPAPAPTLPAPEKDGIPSPNKKPAAPDTKSPAPAKKPAAAAPEKERERTPPVDAQPVVHEAAARPRLAKEAREHKHRLSFGRRPSTFHEGEARPADPPQPVRTPQRRRSWLHPRGGETGDADTHDGTGAGTPSRLSFFRRTSKA